MYPEKIELKYNPVDFSLASNDTEALNDATSAVIRLKFFNQTSDKFIYSVEFAAKNFSLDSDADSVYRCTDTNNVE